MELTIQSALLNVTDLAQSIEFYQDVLGLRLVSEGDRVAALIISDKPRSQVLLLRELGRNAYHGGRGTIGPRLLAFEAGTPDELDAIEQRFLDRQALVWHGEPLGGRRAIMGLDPDRIEVAVSSSLTGTPIPSQAWANLDDMIYAIE
jgi:catechol 2,3-dioxygenase-like lactoylglutathione lyase family enzyme